MLQLVAWVGFLFWWKLWFYERFIRIVLHGLSWSLGFVLNLHLLKWLLRSQVHNHLIILFMLVWISMIIESLWISMIIESLWNIGLMILLVVYDVFRNIKWLFLLPLINILRNTLDLWLRDCLKWWNIFYLTRYDIYLHRLSLFLPLFYLIFLSTITTLLITIFFLIQPRWCNHNIWHRILFTLFLSFLYLLCLRYSQ